MEKVHCICVMRDLYRAMTEMENNLISEFGITLNEGMVICCIGENEIASSAISHHTGMLPSLTSKTLRAIEKKALVERSMGIEDKRQMLFKLSSEGKRVLEKLKTEGFSVPELLQPFFK